MHSAILSITTAEHLRRLLRFGGEMRWGTPDFDIRITPDHSVWSPVSAAVMNDLHPRITDVVNALLHAGLDRSLRPTVSCSLVEETLRFWEDPVTLVLPHHGRLQVSEVTDLQDNTTAGTLKLHCSLLTLRQLPDGTPYVAFKRHRGLMFKHTELEEAYPGWHQRFTIGSTLGLTDCALLIYATGVTRKPVIADTTLNGLTFD